MNNKACDITIVLDRSGSMQSCASDTIGGFNKFLADQQAVPGICTFTLHQFDDRFETPVDGLPITEVKALDNSTFVPRGGTALLDAVGKAIATTGARLKSIREADRPGKVIFVVITDGQENSSKEYTQKQVKDMVEHQKNKYLWEFVFLAADPTAEQVGASFGVPISNSAQFCNSAAGTRTLYNTVSASATLFRTSASYSMAMDDQAKQKLAEPEPAKP